MSCQQYIHVAKGHNHEKQCLPQKEFKIVTLMTYASLAAPAGPKKKRERERFALVIALITEILIQYPAKIIFQKRQVENMVF